MALQLFNGGSSVTFQMDLVCCVPSCGAVRDQDNYTMPFYTFPKSAAMCRQWLDLIRLDEHELGNLANLHRTLVVCSKHFKLQNGGMKLCIDGIGRRTDDGTSSSAHLPDTSPVKKPPRTVSITTGTQTVNSDRIKMLKEELGTHILYGKNIQCRVCIRTSVQAVGIFSKCNKPFYIRDLINDLLPIKVKQSDTKSLNVCVNCIFQLKEYSLLIKQCLKNDNKTQKCIQSQNEKLDSSDLEKTDSDSDTDADCIILGNRNHEIKITLPTNLNSDKTISNENETYSTNELNVKFIAKYTISRGKERINGIYINKDLLDFPKETIDHAVGIINNEMKIQTEKNNSKIVPLPLSPINIVKTNVIDDKIYQETNVRNELMEKQPLNATWLCNRCGLKLHNKENYTSHIKLCHSKPCRFCGKHLTPCSKLIKHEKEHCQKTDGYICHICGRQFMSIYNLRSHHKLHRKRERNCCKICDLQFKNGFRLRKHLRLMHKELLVKKKTEDIQKRKQKCSKCDQWLSTKLALRVHMRTHVSAEERKKTCPTCNKVFICAYRFKLHLLTHGPSLIACTHCTRFFPTQYHVDIHLRSHKITEFKYCDTCHKKFKYKSTLKRHIFRKHQRIQKKFICEFCKIVFSTEDEFTIHNNTHTFGEKAQANDLDHDDMIPFTANESSVTNILPEFNYTASSIQEFNFPAVHDYTVQLEHDYTIPMTSDILPELNYTESSIQELNLPAILDLTVLLEHDYTIPTTSDILPELNCTASSLEEFDLPVVHDYTVPFEQDSTVPMTSDSLPELNYNSSSVQEFNLPAEDDHTVSFEQVYTDPLSDFATSVIDDRDFFNCDFQENMDVLDLNLQTSELELMLGGL